MKLFELVDFLESKLGHPLGDEEYLSYGDATRDFRNISVSWRIDNHVIQKAVEHQCDLLVHHEALLHPYPLLERGSEPRTLSWKVNAEKLGALRDNGLSTFRLHAAADELFVFKAFADKLGLTPLPRESKNDAYFHRVFRTDLPTFGDLVRHVKKAMNLPWVRCCGDVSTKIRTVGLPWGGMGLFTNVGETQKLVELGADCLVCGESDSHAFCYAAEQNLPAMDTSHELSENPGLAAFSDWLRNHLPVDVVFIETPCVWRWE